MMLFNRERAERVMQKHRLDALVASSPDNVMYATDYECSSHWLNKGFQVYSIFTPAHRPQASLIAPSLELEAIVDGNVWVDDVYIFAGFNRGPAQRNAMDEVGRAGKALLEKAHHVRRAADGLVAALEARGLTRGRIGIDESGISPLHWHDLKQRLPNAELVFANSIWWEIRMVKTPAEIERLRKASKITETAINRAFRLLKPGVKESTIVDAYHEELGRLGAKATFMMFGSGSRTSYPHILVSDKVVEANDLVRYDIGCTYDFYHSDMARVVSMGKPTDQQRRICDAFAHGVEDALGLIRPGADVRDIYNAAMKPGRALGLELFDRFHCGHGIGISVYDPPVVTLGDPSSSAFLMPAIEGGLEPGMSLNVEVGYYVQGIEGFLCEDTTVVTADGYERLTHNSKQLLLEDYLRESEAAA
jgi:Xaa-Pro dipeptidase